MKTLFDRSTRDELMNRISSLNEKSTAQWGKMNVAQMMRHCTQWDELAMGKKNYDRVFLGRLFGKVALKDMMKDEPIKRNLPTLPTFKIKDQPDLATEKQQWLSNLDAYSHYSGTGFMHPFFGWVTKEQMGRMAYKHMDHHLRQFNS